MHVRLPLPALVPLALALTACGGSDSTVALRLILEPDLSGRVVAAALVDGGEGLVERVSTGVAWEERAQLVFAAGRFESLSLAGLLFADLELSGGDTPDGLSYLRLVIPRGPDARWPSLLTITDPDRREALEDVVKGGVPRAVRFVVETPRPVFSAAFRPELPGVDGERDGSRAQLSISLDSVALEGDDLVWRITW